MNRTLPTLRTLSMKYNEKHKGLRVVAGGKDLEDQLQWNLEAASDPDKKWTVAIKPVPFIIGRDEDCNLRLNDRLISRHHAEIRISSRHLWIRDLGSKNGTFLNHQKIEQAELLEADDLISIGKSKFIVKNIQSTAAAMAEETCAMTFAEEFPHSDSLESKLRKLLSERNVVPHFQPVLRFPDMTVMGYEILGRVVDEDLPSNPTELFDMAEWLGFSSELSALFRETGINIGKDLPGSPILFANTTSLEVCQMDDLLKSLQKIQHMAPQNRIVLEINEKAAADPDEMMRLREALRELSIGLAFDDFGVGQTRLVELAKAPPDFLKFDLSLIHQIHLAPKRLHQMVSTFVKAAQDLGITTLAEGIECHDEAETCRQLGFDLAQGFFFGKPSPITEIVPPSAQ